MSKIVEIVWRDAYALHHWVPDVDVEVVDTKSVGYLLKRDDDTTVIAYGIGRDGHMCVLAIPNECIIDYTPLTKEYPILSTAPPDIKSIINAKD